MVPPNSGAMGDQGVALATDRIQVHLPGTAEAVRLALADLLTSAFMTRVPPSLAVNAEIVLAEVMNNIVEHAYAAKAGDISLTLTRTKAGIACHLKDCGAAMPGLTLPEGAFQTLGEIEDLPEGGFGWFLIRSLVDDLTYQRANDENHVSFLLRDEQSAS